MTSRESRCRARSRRVAAAAAAAAARASSTRRRRAFAGRARPAAAPALLRPRASCCARTRSLSRTTTWVFRAGPVGRRSSTALVAGAARPARRAAPRRSRSPATSSSSPTCSALGALLHDGRRARHRLGLRGHGRGARGRPSPASPSRRSSSACSCWRALSGSLVARRACCGAVARGAWAARRRLAGAGRGRPVHRAARRELPHPVRRSEHAPRADHDPRGHGARPQRPAARR